MHFCGQELQAIVALLPMADMIMIHLIMFCDKCKMMVGYKAEPVEKQCASNCDHNH